MYIVTSTFDVPEEKAEEVIAIYKNRSKKVDKAEGFIHFKLLQNEKRRGEITVHLEWEEKKHFMNWMQSPEFKEIHDLEKKYPDQELAAIVPKTAQYRVVV